MKYFVAILLLAYAAAHEEETINEEDGVKPAYYNQMMGMGGGMMNQMYDPMMQMHMNPMMNPMHGGGVMHQMYDPMMQQMGGMNPMMQMHMNPMMDPMMQMGMGGMNPMMDPMMGMGGMNQMFDPMQMGMGGMDPMMMGFDPMHSMFSGKVEEEPQAEVDTAQMMMMGGGGCSSTCSCRQQCKMIWWMPCPCPPCNDCGCCNGGDNPPQAPPVTPPPPTEPPTTEPPTQPPCTPCPPTCGGCSCQPCRVWWMCAPKCAPSCCGSGGSSCCNSAPPPPPPPSCCSCSTCVPWMPCKPCRCVSNCCPGSSCCSGSGCQDTDNTVPIEPEEPPRRPVERLPNIRNDRREPGVPDNRIPIERNPRDDWGNRADIDNRIPIERNPWDNRGNRAGIDNRIPIERDPWDSIPPRNPRDPIYLPREPRFREDIDPRDPVYLPPRDRREPVQRPQTRWDTEPDFDVRRDDWDLRREIVRSPRDRDTRDFLPPSRSRVWDEEDDFLRRDPREVEFFPSPRDDFRDPNFRMPTFGDSPPVRSPRL